MLKGDHSVPVVLADEMVHNQLHREVFSQSVFSSTLAIEIAADALVRVGRGREPSTVPRSLKKNGKRSNHRLDISRSLGRISVDQRQVNQNLRIKQMATDRIQGSRLPHT